MLRSLYHFYYIYNLNIILMLRKLSQSKLLEFNVQVLAGKFERAGFTIIIFNMTLRMGNQNCLEKMSDFSKLNQLLQQVSQSSIIDENTHPQRLRFGTQTPFKKDTIKGVQISTRNNYKKLAQPPAFTIHKLSFDTNRSTHFEIRLKSQQQVTTGIEGNSWDTFIQHPEITLGQMNSFEMKDKRLTNALQVPQNVQKVEVLKMGVIRNEQYCKCKKSRCNKHYCDCYASKRICSFECQCEQCLNSKAHDKQPAINDNLQETDLTDKQLQFSVVVPLTVRPLTRQTSGSLRKIHVTKKVKKNVGTK